MSGVCLLTGFHEGSTTLVCGVSSLDPALTKRLLSPVLLLLCAIVLIGAGVATGLVMLRLRDSQASVTLSHAVLSSVAAIEGGTQRARADVRTYLLLSRYDALVSFRAQRQTVEAEAQALVSLVSDNPAQVVRAKAVEAAVAVRMAAYEAEIEGRRVTDDTRRTTQLLAEATEAISRAEVDLLAERSSTTDVLGSRGLIALGCTVLIGLMLIAAVALLTRRLSNANVAHRVALLDAERRAAQATLVEREEEFRALADNISQLAWMAHPDGAIYWYNRRWFDYTGTTLESMLGWGWTEVHDPTYVESIKQRFREAVAAGRDWEDTFPLRAADGSYRWFLSRAKPVRDVTGEVVRWFGTNTDVTDVRQAQASLVDAARRKDEFLAILSHELRNPLSPILVAARLLASPEVTVEQRAWCSSVVLRQSLHMAHLVDDLVDTSRLTRGRLELERMPTDLRRVAAMAGEAVQPLLDARGHRFHMDVESDLPLLDADPVRLTQVVTNLLNNACKFTNPNGQIWLKMSRLEQHVHISVTDTGVGLKSADLETVFDLFAQVDSALTRTSGGLGIGLSLTKGIVELHGGAIRAFSDGPGRGSVFRVSLPLPSSEPLADRLAQDTATALPASQPAARKAPRVLLADDNRDAADSLAAILRLLGHEVMTAYDGAQAVSAAAAFDPDVAVLDIGMPHLNGYEVAAQLRAKANGEKLMLVALTGWGQKSDKLQAVAAGFNHHLTKPVDVDELALLITGQRPADSHRRPPTPFSDSSTDDTR